MFIKPSQKKSRRGYTLIEILVAAALFGVASVAICSIYLFSTRGFASIANYAELDKINRNAMDVLTREIRQAYRVTDVTSNSVALINGDGQSVTFNFNKGARTFSRVCSDGTSKVLVTDCDLIEFQVFQRNNIAGTWNQYEFASSDWAEYVKVIQLTWKASRKIPGTLNSVSEKVQTAKIVIRKQH